MALPLDNPILASAAIDTCLHSALAEQAWIDEQLRAGIDSPRLALVEYKQPAFICGHRGGDETAISQRAEQLGYSLLRRRSGGGAVLAGSWMLGAELLVPNQHWLAQRSLVERFRWLGRCWQMALREQGYASRLAAARCITARNAVVQAAGLDWVCFAGLGHGELLDTQDRKILGLSQYLSSSGVLLSAGLMVAPAPWENFEWIHRGVRPPHSLMHQWASPGLPGLSQTALSLGLVNILRAGLLEPDFAD